MTQGIVPAGEVGSPAPARGEQRFIIHGVSWKDYMLLRETLDIPGLRMTYLVGCLVSSLQFSRLASGRFPPLEKGGQGGFDRKIPLNPPFPKGEAQEASAEFVNELIGRPTRPRTSA